MRRQSYCYFHGQQRRREKRIALRKLMAERHEAQQRERRVPAERVEKTPVFKNFALNPIDERNLRDIFGLSRDGRRICEIRGEGGRYGKAVSRVDRDA